LRATGGSHQFFDDEDVDSVFGDGFPAHSTSSHDLDPQELMSRFKANLAPSSLPELDETLVPLSATLEKELEREEIDRLRTVIEGHQAVVKFDQEGENIDVAGRVQVVVVYLEALRELWKQQVKANDLLRRKILSLKNSEPAQLPSLPLQIFSLAPLEIPVSADQSQRILQLEREKTYGPPFFFFFLFFFLFLELLFLFLG